MLRRSSKTSAVSTFSASIVTCDGIERRMSTHWSRFVFSTSTLTKLT